MAALSEPRIEPPVATGGIRDLRGRAVPVAAPVRRAVVFPPVLGIYLTVDGGPDHVRATARYQTDTIQQGLLRRVFPAAADLPTAATIGRDSAVPGDPEQILALGADAVFSVSQFSASLKSVGVPLVLLDFNPTGTNRDTEAMWRLIAAVAGKESRAEQLIHRYAGERDRVLSSVAGQAGHPRALYLYQSGTSPPLAAFGGTRESRLLDAAGAVNVASGLRGPRLNVEQLLEFAPDVIVISGFAAGNAVQALYADPALRGLPAVRTRRVYRLPTGGMLMDGLVEEPLMLQWLAEILHPDGMPRQFREKLRKTYADVYGVALSDDAMDETLRLDENAGSAGFARFLPAAPFSAGGPDDAP